MIREFSIRVGTRTIDIVSALPEHVVKRHVTGRVLARFPEGERDNLCLNVEEIRGKIRIVKQHKMF